MSTNKFAQSTNVALILRSSWLIESQSISHTDNVYLTGPSSSVPEPRALVSQFQHLILAHARNQMLLFTLIAAHIRLTQRVPQDAEAAKRKRNHG